MKEHTEEPGEGEHSVERGKIRGVLARSIRIKFAQFIYFILLQEVRCYLDVRDARATKNHCDFNSTIRAPRLRNSCTRIIISLARTDASRGLPKRFATSKLTKTAKDPLNTFRIRI